MKCLRLALLCLLPASRNICRLFALIGFTTIAATVAHAQTLADAVDAPQFTWTTGGNQPWAGQTAVRHDGVDAARSGSIGTGQESWIETTVTGPGTLAFWWKVSSDAYFDSLEFQVNGFNPIAPISGEVDWRRELVELGSGSQTLRWRYQRDSIQASGQDRGWVDTVEYFPESGPPTIVTHPAGRTAEEGTSISFEVLARGALPLSYQWYHGATLLPGAVDAVLTLNNLSSTDAGQYTVQIHNSQGDLTSLPAVLNLIPASLDNSFNSTVNGSVYALAVQPDGRVLVGGSFSSLNGQPRANLGRLNADGSLDNDFNPGASGGYGYVSSLALQSDGKILVGGSFQNLGQTTRDSLGRLNIDGSVDTGFAPVIDAFFSPRVNAIQVKSDGKILIGGEFDTVGGQARSGLARLNADGTLDNTFTFNLDLNGGISCIALQANGAILVGGQYSFLNEEDGDLIGYFNMVRLNTNGSLDTGFYPDPDGGISCMAVQPDGKILMSGDFTRLFDGNLNEYQRPGLGRIDGNSNVDASFSPGLEGEVNSIVLQTDGKILVGGSFTSLGGQPRNGIGRLNANGTVDNTFIPSANGPVPTLALQGDGRILVGGDFTTLGGQPHGRLGRLIPTTPPTETLNYSGTTITWQRGGTSPEVGRTTFEHSADGNTWTTLGAGSRVSGGWQRTGASVPAGNTIRARGYLVDGYQNSSSWFVESIRGKPAFLSQPSSRTNHYGTAAIFAAAANGTAPLGYRWLKNGAPLSNLGNISGATTNSLILNPVSKGDEGSYRLVVSNSFGNVTSLVATLTVLDPAILQQPESADRKSGESVTFEVLAVGAPTLSYQWYRDTELLNGATGPSLTLQNLTAGNSGSYRVVVSNPTGALTSSNALLTVTTVVSLAEALDAPTLTWSSGGNLPWFGQIDLAHDGIDSAQSGTIADSQESWLETTVTGPGPLTFWWKVSSESSFDFLEFYINGQLQSGRISGNVNWQQKSFSLGDGTQVLRWRYSKDAVYSSGQDRGWVDQVSFTAIEPGPPVIVTQPQGKLVVAGADVTINVIATGIGPLTYQWFKGDTALDGATGSALTLINVQSDVTAYYSAVVGNSFGSVTSLPALLTLNPVVTLENGFNPGVVGASYHSVDSFAVQTDGKILVGGYFTNLAGQARTHIARLNSDGSLDSAFNPAAIGGVSSLALQPDGRILLGGNFIRLGGQVRNRIARLNDYGTLDAGFNPGADGTVNTLVLQPDGKLLISGSFTNLAGQTRNRIARLEGNGTLDATFAPDADSSVGCLALQTDGKVLVGGEFTNLAGQVRLRLGRLNSDGTLDVNFNPGANGPIYSMALQPDGRILVGGGFSILSGQPRSFIGRLNKDGTLDTTFDAGSTYGTVNSLVLQTDGKLIVGGYFSSIAGHPHTNLARLNPDGTPDDLFNLGANSSVGALALQPDGQILVGGGFTNVVGQARDRIARLNNLEPATQNLGRAGNTITWLRGGISPEVWRTTFESSNDGSTWTELGAGTRVAGGWQLTGVLLQPEDSLRARGYVSGGYQNGSNWFVESLLTADPIIHLNVVRDGSTMNLNWTGGSAPFQVQQTTNLTYPIDWQDYGAPAESHSLSVPFGPGKRFWRIRRP